MPNWSSPLCTWPRQPAAATCAASFSTPTAAANTPGGSCAGRGSCFDNAVSEAFNSVLKVEYVHRHTFVTRAAARIRIATWITDFYSARRIHSVCGFKSPIGYEHDYWADLSKKLAA
ncbi:integrase core domain-containing protein [Streptomyces sp. NBC_01446]|nr:MULTISPECIES: integrase core domain-containing protein [unclassified Streptomyces]MCX4649353.1 integrase core domain-containing protein [Streptomyces sp. NBC_01446]MCX5321448.1 integrase core domain-containing protein [Streptomyces sp. NBC_00120]